VRNVNGQHANVTSIIQSVMGQNPEKPLHIVLIERRFTQVERWDDDGRPHV